MKLLFDKISKQFSEKKPFVCFKKPNRSQIKAYFCKSDEIVYTHDFIDQGFVFAPFNDKDPSIVFLEKDAEVVKSNFKEGENKNSITQLKTNISNKKEHILLVEKGISEIKQGVFKKVVLSRKELIELSDFELLNAFERLLNAYSNAFVYLWYHPKIGIWMGATPERLVSLRGNEFKTVALASTQVFEGDLHPVWGEKEKEEHQYVVDYIVSQIKNPSNGIVLSEFDVSETYTSKAGNLLHLKADIRGEIGDFELKKLLKTLHPTPAVCGLSKDEAKKFIINNENYNRTYYTGFLGEINIDSSTELFVNLRCAEFIDNAIVIYVGGGITSESNPEKEWLETAAKTQTIKSVL